MKLNLSKFDWIAFSIGSAAGAGSMWLTTHYIIGAVKSAWNSRHSQGSTETRAVGQDVVEKTEEPVKTEKTVKTVKTEETEETEGDDVDETK